MSWNRLISLFFTDFTSFSLKWCLHQPDKWKRRLSEVFFWVGVLDIQLNIKEESITDVFRRVLWKFQNSLFYRIPLNKCICKGSEWRLCLGLVFVDFEHVFAECRAETYSVSRQISLQKWTFCENDLQLEAIYYVWKKFHHRCLTVSVRDHLQISLLLLILLLENL